ncbi:hypothetical protein JCM11251_007470 [Rhodosporidiobolus azoricus]
MRFPFAAPSSLSALVVLIALAGTARAYIPAVPTNDTSSLDASDDLIHLAFTAGVYNARISRQLWQQSFDDEGQYTNVSSVVPWTKYNKGVLIHFDESLRYQPPASVPWIAMISCDTNGTSYSDEDDIFTICRDLGAEAALLYSTSSEGCQINNYYLTSFEKVLDVFATTTLQMARIIEQQFINVNSAAYQYDSATLNNSASIIQTLLDSNALSVNGNVPVNATSTDLAGLTSSIGPTLMTAGGAVESSASPTSPSVFDPDNDGDDDDNSGSTSAAPANPSSTAPSLFSNFASPPDRLLLRRQQASPSSTEPTLAGSATRSSVVPSPTSTSTGTTNYLGAVLAAGNLTVGGLLSASPSPSSSGDGGGGGGRSTGLAMIILYAITGVVCLLFLVVILSGAIRALRHPERYGPRGTNGLNGQGGGAGQTRAAGLTRAILDTFPVVRFGGDAAARRDGARDEEAAAEVEGGPKKDVAEGEEVELATLPAAAPPVPPVSVVAAAQGRMSGDEDEIQDLYATAVAGAGRRRSTSRSSSAGRESFHSAVEVPLSAAAPQHVLTSHDSSSSSPASSSPRSPPSTPLSPHSATYPPTSSAEATTSLPPPISIAVPPPGTAGRGAEDEEESCPICFTEFEPGDELRVLPCDQRHIFHTGCIDPWLLEVSSSCPLCRLDLASTAQPASSFPPTSPTSPTESDARHEEERVIRHLRALLHRGAQAASAAGTAGGLGGGAVGVPSGSGAGYGLGTARRESNAGGGAGEEDGQARLRGRFARYVAARRERVRVAGVGVGVGMGVGRRRRNTNAAGTNETEGVPA